MKTNRKLTAKLRRWQGKPDDAGKRPSVYLGSLDQEQFDKARMHLRQLQTAHDSGLQVPKDSAAWLQALSAERHATIAATGLCEARIGARRSDVTLANYAAGYIQGRSDLGERARLNLRQAERKLVEHFGNERSMSSIKVGDAKAYRQWLEGQKYALATISMHIKKARQVFADAVDFEILSVNPFKKVQAGSQVNSANMRYVEEHLVERVMAQADSEFTLIIALARYAGLRCPSELTAMRLDDIDWDQNKMLVASEKTRKQGKASRFVPIGPNLRKPLLDAFHAAPEGQELFFPTRYKSSNLRTQIGRLCERAGLTPWPKRLQNLRLSCETDWMDSATLPLACKWSGNTPEVALKHYHLVRDTDYVRAATRGAESGAEQCRIETNRTDSKQTKTPASVDSIVDCAENHGKSLAGVSCQSTPKGSRTPVRRLRTVCPGPLDDGGVGTTRCGACTGVRART